MSIFSAIFGNKKTPEELAEEAYQKVIDTIQEYLSATEKDIPTHIIASRVPATNLQSSMENHAEYHGIAIYTWITAEGGVSLSVNSKAYSDYTVSLDNDTKRRVFAEILQIYSSVVMSDLEDDPDYLTNLINEAEAMMRVCAMSIPHVFIKEDLTPKPFTLSFDNNGQFQIMC